MLLRPYNENFPNPLSTALFTVIISVVRFLFGYTQMRTRFKASRVKDMVNKPNWLGATRLLFRKRGRVEFQTMKTNQIQPTVRAGS